MNLLNYIVIIDYLMVSDNPDNVVIIQSDNPGNEPGDDIVMVLVARPSWFACL